MAGEVARIFELATRQHGVVSTTQLHRAGLSEDQIALRARKGWLERLHRGVYAVGHGPLTWRGRWMAAVLAAGDGAVLSHRSAGALWELGCEPGTPVEVTVPSAGGRRPPPCLKVHRCQPFCAGDRTSRHAIPVTTPARTLLDLAAVLPRRRLERAVDEAGRLGRCDLSSLDSILATNAGRPGAVALARVTREHRVGSTLTRSELEERFLALCRRHRLPQPKVNVPLLDYTVDFLWEDAGLIVEVDGHASHGTRAAFQADRARDARLTAAGYRTLRFTYGDVVRDGAVVANRVRTVLRLVVRDRGA